MTDLYLNYHLSETTPVRCDQCGWQGQADEVEILHDAQNRLYPGEEIPAGECPDCGSCAYVVKSADKRAPGFSPL